MQGVSKSKRLYIVRHGETDYNRQGLVQGRGINAPLNDFGKRQAKAFYDAYHICRFDKVYTSNLLRTEQSVAAFIAAGVPHQKLEGLDEISWGSQEGVAFSEESKNLYLETVAKWRAGDLDATVAGGESPKEVMKRQKKAMDVIMSEEGERDVLICMHGRAIRILISWLLGYDLTLMDEFPHSNLGLYLLHATGSMFQIERINDTSHLVELSEAV